MAEDSTESLNELQSSAAGLDDRHSLRGLLTVILTTSPIPSHPATDLLDHTILSMQQAVGLPDCRLLIVCDGFKLRDDGSAPKYRSGVVDQDAADRYERYRATLRLRRDAGEFDLLELDERQGFGFAVKAALPHVDTPFVLVMQHDRAFNRIVEIEPLVSLMQANSWLKYLGMPTSTTLNYEYHVLSKYGLRLQAAKLDDIRSAVPLIQWYDSAHLARMDYYRDFVFGPRKLVTKGGFIEDKFGQQQLADIRSKGMEAHAEYGTFILNDGVDAPIIVHLDGRDSRIQEKCSVPGDTAASIAAKSTKPGED